MKDFSPGPDSGSSGTLATPRTSTREPSGPRPPASIRLLHPSEVPRERPLFPYLPVGYALGLLLCLAIPIGTTVMFCTNVTWVAPFFGWVLLPLLALVLYGVCGFIARIAFEHLRASFRSSNWLAQLGADGVHLNLRSFLNWRFPAGDRTVAFVPYAAIASVHSLHETFVLPYRQHRTIRYHSFTILTLKPGVETAEVEAVVRDELLRVPTQGFLASFLGWDDVPVFVGRPGELWIYYRPGFLRRALARHMPRRPAETRRVSGDVLAERGDVATIRRLGLEALYRGHRVEAARALGLGLRLEPRAADELLLEILKTGV